MTKFWLLAAVVVAATWYLVDGRDSDFLAAGVAGKAHRIDRLTGQTF